MASSLRSASASTSTADGNNCCYQYDVFLNHRGPDVKKTFASHLYRSLKEHGLRVFLDQEEMQKGEKLSCQIEGAIRASSVHIAIFSTNYAQSNWCLDELVLMLKSMRESRTTVIPIFYGVKPSQVRWTERDNGLYARALRILGRTRGENGVYSHALRILEEKKRYDTDTIRQWRRALYDAAEISGFELEAYNGRDEGQLVADVVERVLEIVPKTPLHVSKYPTGLDGKVKDFEERVLLQQPLNGEARVVGIWGLGGVGKTTLAKELFNRERTKYRRSSFLSDVRENHNRGSLESLQRQLIKDLNQQDLQINNTDEGISLLKKHLLPSSALIIVDGVDHLDQLEALISPAKDVLASSSLILVTSRNKDVLKSWGIGDSFIYKLEGLNSQHSTELFCSHAFQQLHPVQGFEQVVKEFVAACDGLPLSLKVIGALLYGQNNLEYWKAQLCKIDKMLPADIQKRLKISYDSLEEDEKQIFLDIACFFIGEDKDTAIRIWNGCGWEGWLGLQKLQNKCLVECHRKKWSMFNPVLEVEGQEFIGMHDQLRDLGRHLAKREHPSRFWRLPDNLSVDSPEHIRSFRARDPGRHLVEKARLKCLWHLPDNPWLDSPVRGITNLSYCSQITHWQLNSLQLLSAEGDSVEKVFSTGQSPQLIWLRWYNCPHSSIPSMIPMRNLRVLYIGGNNLKTVWQHESQVPLKLRELHFATATTGLLEIPKSIGLMKHLEKIILEPNKILGKIHLRKLPSEFCHLQSLKHLELRSCTHLKKLPEDFCRLTNLQHINLNECYDLEMLPTEFGNLTNLRHLRLTRSQLDSLPDSFGNLTNLQHVDLSYSNLYRITSSFVKLTNLRHISLSGCSRLEMLPDCFGNLTNLQHIDLSHCSRLKMLPYSFWDSTNLQYVDLSHCSHLEVIPYSHRDLTKLQYFNWSNCTRLKILPNGGLNVPSRRVDVRFAVSFSEMPAPIASYGNESNKLAPGSRLCKTLIDTRPIY